MTASRIRGSKGVVSNSEDGVGRLEGLLPVIEDWHAKMCPLEVASAQISWSSANVLCINPRFSGSVYIVLLQ